MPPIGTAMSRRLESHPSQPGHVGELVIVTPDCERFCDLVAAGRRGDVGIHFCVDGRSALRMSRRFRADVWLVAAELPDMSGFDLVEMLLPSVARAELDPLLVGRAVPLDQIRDALRSAVFIVAEGYSFADEQRALQAGAAGYIAGPVRLDLLRDARQRRHAGRQRARIAPQAR